jgi:hypothetical protein
MQNAHNDREYATNARIEADREYDRERTNGGARRPYRVAPGHPRYWSTALYHFR